MRYFLNLRCIALIVTMVSSSAAQAIDVTFTDVASDVGLDYVGQTFGQSWGDYDNDGYADLYVSNHGFATTIFKNMNGLSFADQSALLTADLTGDIHGGAWADFDNDGDRDLLFIEGASGGAGSASNRFMVNTDGVFVDQASLWGLEYPLARGRMASWFDWNQDGLLDVGLANWPRTEAPTAIFTRSTSVFTYDNDNLGFATSFSNNFMSLVQVNGYPEPALLVNTVFGFPEGYYDMTTAPFLPLEQALGLPSVSATWDFMSEDFDGNLDQELFFVRQVDSNEVVLFSDTELRGRVYGLGVGELSFTFATQGPIDFSLGPVFGSIPLPVINIGPNNIAPDALTFTLDPADVEVIGESIHDEASSLIYIHYDNVAELWKVAVTNRLRPNIQVFSQSIISNVETQNFTSSDGARTAIKYNQSPQGYVSFPSAFGLTVPYPCRSGAAADFDNDMDVDVYLGCTSGAINRPNLLLENNGTGTFSEVADAAGAAGSVDGRTDVVTVADYDNDGFMDIMVSNGLGTKPFAVGPTQLFHNNGNSNSWIHINLVGVTANRDGIGAWVEVEAGGVTQSRLQDNGSKRFGQDDQRLHFGLASNTTVDSIRVRWPGGQEQLLSAVAANQILTIVQDVDSDSDGVFDSQDNCRELSNPAQLDTDADGFGNRCDPDFNNDVIVNFLDLQILGKRFLSDDVEADLNGDGVVNFIDFAIFSDFFLLPPGPGASGQNQ